jgi:lactate dehydrogenase-like 2-hydroxyacid dehydrogenase
MKELSARRFEANRGPSNIHDTLREVSGFTLGTVGLGGIGTDVAYRAHYGYGMKILAVDPKPLPKPPSSTSFTRWIGSPRWFHKWMCWFARRRTPRSPSTC